MRRTLTLIPGAGMGREVASAAVRAQEGHKLTRDLGGTAGPPEIAEAIAGRV